MSDRDPSPGAGKPEEPPASEHLNIKVTDNHNEVFFKIKRTTALKKLMDAFCDRQGKQPATVRFLFDGARVQPTDSPDSVSRPPFSSVKVGIKSDGFAHLMPRRVQGARRHTAMANGLHFAQLDMADGDTLEVHQEQIGGC